MSPADLHYEVSARPARSMQSSARVVGAGAEDRLGERSKPRLVRQGPTEKVLWPIPTAER